MISLQGCSEWWIRSSHKHMQREPGVVEWLRPAVFFMPHLLFRITSLSLILAFSGYWSLLLLAPIVPMSFYLAQPVVRELRRSGGGDDQSYAYLSLILSLLLPAPILSCYPSHVRLMKRTITLITFSLLIVLTLIRTLPTLIDPETLVATPGLCHLNFDKPSGAKS